MTSEWGEKCAADGDRYDRLMSRFPFWVNLTEFAK